MAATQLTPVDIKINSRKTVLATEATFEHYPSPRKRYLSQSDDDDVVKASKCKKSKNDRDNVNHSQFRKRQRTLGEYDMQIGKQFRHHIR